MDVPHEHRPDEEPEDLIPAGVDEPHDARQAPHLLDDPRRRRGPTERLEGASEPRVMAPERRLDEGQMDQVALGEAPAALIRLVAHVGQAADARAVVAEREVEKRLAEGPQERFLKERLRGGGFVRLRQQGEGLGEECAFAFHHRRDDAAGDDIPIAPRL